METIKLFFLLHLLQEASQTTRKVMADVLRIAVNDPAMLSAATK
jgi:hypothetical protein